MSLNDNPVSSLGVGRASIKEGGKAVSLSTESISCVWVTVTAEANGIWVGGEKVKAPTNEEEDNAEGVLLQDEDTITIPVNRVGAVWVNSKSTGSVTFMYGVA